MSLQAPPNSTGSVIATLTSGSKEYQENILSDGVTPTQLASILLPGAAETLEIASVRVSSHTLDGNKATFRSCTIARSPGTSATTTLGILIGSATKVVRLTSLRVSFTEATAAAAYNLILNKRTTAASSGTASTETVVPNATGDTATGVVKFYTVTPTQGSGGGAIATAKIFGSITGTPAAVDRIEFIFGRAGAKCPRLADNTETFELTINAATPANAGSWDVEWEWTEE